MLFGLPFLAAGLGIMIFGSTGKFKDDSGKPMPPIVALLFGGVFAMVGGGLVFGRSGVILDKRTKRAVKWWGLMVPMKQTTVPLETVSQVAITKEIRRSDKSTYTVYPVRLSHGEGRFHVCEPRSYKNARSEAEDLAKFLEVELADMSEGEAKVRQANELDHSIRDQARNRGESIEVPAVPTGCRVKHDLSSGKLTLEVPAPGISPALLVVFGVAGLVPLGFLGFMASKIFGDGGAPLFFKAFFAVFALVFMAPIFLIPGRMFLMGKSRERVSVTPEELELAIVSPLWTKSVSIPADEIEELELAGEARAGGYAAAGEAPPFVKSVVHGLGGGATIVARSDKQSLNFGRGLTVPEAQWMHALIKRVLTS